tara:strand:+ start:1301 stop:2065 length:765 start_codon:yes stop_codon:yes gene_type:complete
MSLTGKTFADYQRDVRAGKIQDTGMTRQLFQQFGGLSRGQAFTQNFTDMDPAVRAAGTASVIGGIGGIVSGLTGMGKARRQRDNAKKQFDKEMAGLAAVDVNNPFARMRNPYANLRVNQQQAQFQAQQGQQSLVDILAQTRAGVGGSGVAALAQAMANQSTQMMQQASASIGEQESRNTFARAEGEMSRQMAIGQGEQGAQQLRAEKASVLTGYAADRLQSANEALAAKQNALGQGIGSLVGGVGSLAGGNLFG